jgi:hypothetical protein
MDELRDPRSDVTSPIFIVLGMILVAFIFVLVLGPQMSMHSNVSNINPTPTPVATETVVAVPTLGRLPSMTQTCKRFRPPRC